MMNIEFIQFLLDRYYSKMKKEILNRLSDFIPRLSFGRKFEEDFKLNIKGEVFWTLRNSSTGETESGYMKNVVTFDASLLVAALMKGPVAPLPHVSEPNFGIYALTVGTGDIGWDLQNPPPANKNQRSLYNELARKQISSSSFIDAGGNPVGYRTNVVDFTTIFSESEAVGPWAEMGLIGGDVDTNMAIRNPVLPPNGSYDPTFDTSGFDTLINYRTFKVINKPDGSTMTMTIRLSF